MLYIEKITNIHQFTDDENYPYNIPSIQKLKEMYFRKPVTFIIGDNGSGKSTLIEAIAVKAGFNPEGGGKNFNFSTQATHSDFYMELRMTRSAIRNQDGYFMRAESLYNLASEIDQIGDGIHSSYGGRSLHEQSHGESFLSVFQNRLFGKGLYIFDEPEAALSLKSMFAMMVRMKELIEEESQFIIATHSPVLLAFPDADIYSITEEGWEKIEYEECDQYRITKYFISNYQNVLKELFDNKD